MWNHLEQVSISNRFSTNSQWIFFFKSSQEVLIHTHIGLKSHSKDSRSPRDRQIPLKVLFGPQRLRRESHPGPLDS